MPRIEHEPWCENHNDEVGAKDEAGECTTWEIEFGPSEFVPALDRAFSVGTLTGCRFGDEAIRVYLDYRTGSGGFMDVDALRAVREAVAESPAEFLTALDGLIDTMGADVPPAHRSAPTESIAS